MDELHGPKVELDAKKAEMNLKALESKNVCGRTTVKTIVRARPEGKEGTRAEVQWMR